MTDSAGQTFVADEEMAGMAGASEPFRGSGENVYVGL